MPNEKRYIGFSITAGHPTRIKEISVQEIIKVANHYSKDFVPTFFIEDKCFGVASQIFRILLLNIYLIPG